MPLLVHNMCLVRLALLYLSVHVLKVFYEQINYCCCCCCCCHTSSSSSSSSSSCCYCYYYYYYYYVGRKTYSRFSTNHRLFPIHRTNFVDSMAIFRTYVTRVYFLLVWRSGSALVLTDEVKLRRARLVLGWVTVYGFNSRCRTFISVSNQPPRSTQPGHPFVSRCN